MRHSDGWKLPPGEVPPSYTSSLSPAQQPSYCQQKHPKHEGRRLKRRLRLSTAANTESTPLPPPVDAWYKEC